nr:glutamate receptor 2.8-like [Aegilops tauschii subsp. strangulata]
MGVSALALPASAAVFSLLLLSNAGGSPPSGPVAVGALLDLTSDVGRQSLTCISMALEDFHAAHAGSGAARVELRVRDSRGDVVAAANAADDLIRTDRVQAIIGPQTSAESEFIAYLGNHTHTPILSLAPTSAALTPFHLQIAPNESFQVAPVAAILDMFTWRTTTVVYEDSPYGARILAALFSALQGYNIRVMDSIALPVGVTDDYLDKVLYNLKETPTRVFIVHMHPDLAARVFYQATIAGMMSDGYIWIATSTIGSVVESLSADKIDHMQGVVTFRPYVQATGHIMNFTARFKSRFLLDNPGIHNVHNPSTQLLWAYDTAWALAKAVHIARMSSSTPWRMLLGAVLNTAFDGLSGRFGLVNGQLQLSTHEVINIVSKGARKVGFWMPESGILKSLETNSAKGLKQVLWPGHLAIAPKGWDVSSNRRPLRMVVPEKQGFNQFVEVTYSPATNSSTVRGYCIDIFDMVMKNLPYPVAYQYVPVSDSSRNYDNLLSLVHEKKADGMVGDTTITMRRMNVVSFTKPFTDTGLSMVVGVKKETDGGMWIFLQPLTTTLWITSLAFFCFTGFVVWVVEHRINPEFRGTPCQQFGTVFYFAFSTLVFSHKEKLESNLSRFMVIIWLFLVLILASSYTANLTSVLTVQRLQPTVTSVQDLLRNGDYVGYHNGSIVPYWLEKMGFRKEILLAYSTVEEYSDALRRGSGNGGVSAIFDEIPYLKAFLSKYCEGYTMIGPTYRLGGFAFAFPIGTPIVHDVSQAILSPAVQEEMERIEKKWFGDPGACQSKSNSIGSSSLGFSSFGGLFLVSGTVSGLVLLIQLAIFVYQEHGKLWDTSLHKWFQCLDFVVGAKDWRLPIFNGPRIRNDDSVNQPHEATTEASAMHDFTSEL